MRSLIRFLILVLCILGPAKAFAQQKADQQITALIEQLKKKANLKLDPTTTQSAIDTSAYELTRLSKPTMAVSVSQEGLDALAARELAKPGGNFSHLRFIFSAQTAQATVDYAGIIAIPTLGDVDVNAELHAQLAVSAELVTDRPTADFKIRTAVTALDVTSLKLSRGGQPLPSLVNNIADALISGLLIPAQSLLNRIELRAPTIIAAKVDFRPTKQQGLSIDFDPKAVAPQLKIVAATFLLDRGRLIILAQDAGPVNNVPNKPKNVSFETYHDNFHKAFTGIGATWINQGQFSSYVESSIIERLTSKLLEPGSVCMQAKAVDIATPVHQKLTLPPESSIDCTPTRDCTPKKECSQTMDCAQTAACGDVCTFRAPITGHCVTHGHDLGCEAGKVARKLGCETDKEHRRLQCEAEKTATKVACEGIKQSEKDTCEGLKEAYKRLRGTGPDYANVDSNDLRLNGGAKICLNQIKFDSKTLHLTGTLQAEAATNATGKITFTPLNVLGHLACFAPFDFNLSETIRVAPQPINVDTFARLDTETGSIAIESVISNSVQIRFPFGAIAAKLAENPKFISSCPIPGVATQFRALTPDAWWPKVARGEIDKALPSFSFNLDLFTKPIDVDGLALLGRLKRTDTGIGAVFTVGK
jgi:hypothetical protein